MTIQSQTRPAVKQAGPEWVCPYCGGAGCNGECGQGRRPLRGVNPAKQFARRVVESWHRFLTDDEPQPVPSPYRTMTAAEKAEYDAGFAAFSAGIARHDPILGLYGQHGWLAAAREWDDGQRAYASGFAARNPSVVATWPATKLAGYMAAKRQDELAKLSEGDFLSAALDDLRQGTSTVWVRNLSDEPGDPVGYHESRQPFQF